MISTLPNFAMYLVTSLALIVAALWAYVKITPYNELTLIRQGNTSAAVSLAGTMLGMVVAMGSAIVHSVGFIDMVVWSAIGLVVQLAAWSAVNHLFGNLHLWIAEKECMAHGTMLAAASLSIGALQAACMAW